MLNLLIVPIILGQLFWIIKIGYPPTLEQINLGVSNNFNLQILRILCLFLVSIILYVVSTQFKSKIKTLFFIFACSIPALSSWVMSYPLVILRLFVVVMFSVIVSRTKPKMLFIFLGVVFIYCLNVYAFKDRPAVLDIISLKNNQFELTSRINTEDEINPKINLPLSFRRLGYNKYFFVIKNISNFSLKYFDFESLFFQEVHPLEQKGFVLFYWPLIWLFVISLFLLIKKKIIIPCFFYLTIFFGFLFYLFSDQSPEHYLSPLIFFVCALLASTINWLLSQNNKLINIVATLFIFLNIYSFSNNIFDRFKRPDYWLDNRPLVYRFWFDNLKSLPLSNAKIIMTDVVGPSSVYCRYFLKNCDNFTFVNFDQSSDLPKEDNYYVGYVGNFLGRQSQNTFPSNQEQEIYFRGYQIIATSTVRDNVVFGYGNNIYITQYHEPKTK